MAIRFDQVRASDSSKNLAAQMVNMVPQNMRRSRNDAEETAFLAQSLEYLSAQMIEVEYGVLLSKDLIPLKTDIHPGAQTFAYKQWSQVGMAKLIANPSDDVPMVDTLVQKFDIPIVTLASGYSISFEELQAALYSNTPIDAMKALAARNANERKIDELLAFGDPEIGMYGLLNNPNIPYIDVTDDFPTADPAEMLLDLQRMERTPYTATKQHWKPDTLLVTPAVYSRISQTPISAQAPQETVLTAFLRNSRSIRRVEEWYLLETANAGAPRAMAYKYDPMTLQGIVPLMLYSMPPEQRGLHTITNVLSRVGGTVVYRPLSAVYLNGTGE